MIARRQFLVAAGGVAASAGLLALPALPAWAAGPAARRWPVPPQHPRIPTDVGRLGYHRIDDYAWFKPKDWHAVLRAPDALDAPIKAAILAENAYTAAMLAPSQPLQQQLIQRLEALDTLQGAPLQVRDGDFYYYQREQAGSDYPVYARRPVAGGAEQVLLDVGAEANGKQFYKLGFRGPQRSQDGRLFGWAADLRGSDIFTLHVRDIATGKMLVDDISDAYGGFAFSPDGRYLFWVGRSDKGRPSKVMRREIGAGGGAGAGAGAGDTLIYENTDPAFFIGLRTTTGGGYLVIRTFNGAMSEARLVPMAQPTSTPVLVEPRVAGVRYTVDEWNGNLLLLTDADGAVDYKLMTASFSAPGRANWKPLVPHQPGRFILAIHPFADYLVREEWRDALPRLVVMTKDGNEHDIAFDEAAYAISVAPDQGWSSPTLAFNFQSPQTPRTPCRLTLASGQVTRLNDVAPSAVYDRAHYDVRRLVAPAADGALIPITVLMRKGQKLDGSAPLYQYGYGAYAETVNAEFSAAAIAAVDHGWIYAIAHVRGGAERGSAWARAVLKHGKKTTFTDFITCAEYLIAGGYTRPRRIVAHGFSAGGLLMGAVYTMRPDLWAGVIARVPFLDVLTTLEHFDERPLGTTSFVHWGDPRVPEDHAYMATYSPYDQLKTAAYPALFALGSVADNHVSFWEPLKFAVKARTVTTAGYPILSLSAMHGGHGGASGAAAQYAEQASLLAFAIWSADRKWGDVPQRPA
jgi:oligopeptidase B